MKRIEMARDAITDDNEKGAKKGRGNWNQF